LREIAVAVTRPVDFTAGGENFPAP
jgi:hypothetical protein